MRQLLNLGHTVAHSIESLSNFEISHGSAVAIGTAVIARAATAMGLCSESDRDEIISLLSYYSLPIECHYSAKEIADIALSDKKRSGGNINLIVPFGIGNTQIYKISVDSLEDFLAKGL